MGFPILVRCHLYIESGPRCHHDVMIVAASLWCYRHPDRMGVGAIYGGVSLAPCDYRDLH